MAFGDLLGTLSGRAATIAASNDLTGSVSVAADDLIFVVFGQQSNLTVTGITDNLGNTYSAVSAGTDPGSPTARAFYSVVTSAGTLTTVTAAATASVNDYAGFVAVIEGPFDATPLDAAPTDVSNDVTSPFTCPATGTLAQADEAVMAYVVANQSGAFTATSPNLLAGNVNISTTVRIGVGYQAVSATTSVQPEFTASVPTGSVLGTASFKKAATGASTIIGKGLLNSPLLGRRRLVA